MQGLLSVTFLLWGHGRWRKAAAGGDTIDPLKSLQRLRLKESKGRKLPENTVYSLPIKRQCVRCSGAAQFIELLLPPLLASPTLHCLDPGHLII